MTSYGHADEIGHRWVTPPAPPCPACDCCTERLCTGARERHTTCADIATAEPGRIDVSTCTCSGRDSE